MYNPSPKAVLLKYPGTNCDPETARALEMVGFRTEIVPISQAERHHFEDASLAVFSGGFSYGDYVMSGRMAQLITQQKLDGVLEYFVANGGHMLGICNGFQILTKLGLLPHGNLIDNTSGRYICRWAKMNVLTQDSPFLNELPTDRPIELPIAHAEGRFVAPEGAAEQYLADGLVTLQYAETVNGSTLNIAGLQDKSGRVFGLMPHPERFIYKRHHYDPDWSGDSQYGWGYYLFSSIYRQCSGSHQLIA
jgi:phosphoribosylformylglycinamidine synthase subunit PurQ / glutaminase